MPPLVPHFNGLGCIQLIFAVLLVLHLSAVVTAATQYSDCRVERLITVHSAGSFTCKPFGWQGIGPVRLRVQVAGVELKEDDLIADRDEEKTQDPRDFTAAKLKAAGSIELKNIEMRNYFRVIADVYIDGQSLADQLIGAGLAERVIDEPEIVDNAPQPGDRDRGDGRPVDWWRRQAQRGSMPRPDRDEGGHKAMRPQGGMRGHRPHRQPMQVSLTGMLRFRTDLSELRVDMTFQEAMDYLRAKTTPPMPITVMWPDLEENAFVDPDKPIGVDGFGVMELRKALQIILRSVSVGSPSELEYVVDGGMITIATTQMGLSLRKYQEVYHLDEVAQAAWQFMQSGGFSGSNQRSNPYQR
jgi:hypothetical protein